MFGSLFVVLCSVFAWSLALGAQPPIDGPTYGNGNDPGAAGKLPRVGVSRRPGSA